MSARRAGQALKEPARSIPPPPPFLQKTYDMVDNPETDSIISWGPDGTSFIVWKTAEFARDILPEHFKHNNFSSFVRQLNTYGFRKIDPDRWEFANDFFVRGNRDMLGEIHRRKPSGSVVDGRPSHRDAGALSAVELGAYGGLKAEVEQLKRDKKVLVEEVVRLRQAQLSSEAAMHTMQHRLGATEARQQQMISFLAKAMQHPAILAQFPGAGPAIHRIDDGRRRKKRRGRSGVRAVSADHESESETSDGETGSPFGSSGSLQGADRRMIVHPSGAAGPSQNAGGSLADLAHSFMQLMNGSAVPQGPATGGSSSGPQGVTPASGDAHTSAGGYHPSSWVPDQHLGSVPIVQSEPAKGHSATDQKATVRDNVTYPAGFVPLMSEGPTITEVGHEPITELPALDNFSLDDLDFGGLAELDKDLLGTTGAADPATLWHAHAGVDAGALPVAVEIPETSPPSFAMPDFSDLTPIISEPRRS